jgi:CvfB-like winged helix domain
MRCPFERHGRPILRLSGGTNQQQHRVASTMMLFRRGHHPSAIGGWEQHHRLFATQQEPDEDTTAARTPSSVSRFQRGMMVIVEVMKFGPLGASVDVVAKSHDPNDVIPASADALGQGLIDQQEISYYRSSRDGLDVVLGEVLKGYVTSVRPEDGKLSIGLRPFGGRGKATEIGARIMERLQIEGRIPVGDRSKPEDIEREFPGASKLAFKKAVAALYKEGKVQPGPFSIAPYGITKDDPPRR